MIRICYGASKIREEMAISSCDNFSNIYIPPYYYFVQHGLISYVHTINPIFSMFFISCRRWGGRTNSIALKKNFIKSKQTSDAVWVLLISRHCISRRWEYLFLRISFNLDPTIICVSKDSFLTHFPTSPNDFVRRKIPHFL